MPGATFGSEKRSLHRQVAQRSLDQLLMGRRPALVALNSNHEAAEARLPKRTSAARRCHISYEIIFLLACIQPFVADAGKNTKKTAKTDPSQHEQELLHVGVLTLASCGHNYSSGIHSFLFLCFLLSLCSLAFVFFTYFSV